MTSIAGIILGVSADLTIEQLAAQTGMTVRNIRAHQARGLLDPPEVRLRVGYYGPEHVARIRLIRTFRKTASTWPGSSACSTTTRARPSAWPGFARR